MQTRRYQSSFHVCEFFQLEQHYLLIAAKKGKKNRSFLLCNAFWHIKLRGKSSRAHVHRLWSKLCKISYEVHAAGGWFIGGKVTVTGDVWPIFSSSKHICSAQELHQLCFSLSLSSLFPSLWCSLSPCSHSLGASSTNSPLPVSLLLLAFFQLCLFTPSHCLLFLLSHFPACSVCVGVRLQIHLSEIALKLFFKLWMKQHLP